MTRHSLSLLLMAALLSVMPSPGRVDTETPALPAPADTPAPAPGDNYSPPVEPSPASVAQAANGSAAESAPVLLTLQRLRPHQFGLMLGDVLEQTLTLRLPRGQYLNPNTLPPSGRINDWLDLAVFQLRRLPDQPSPDARYGDTRYEVTRHWQLFRPVEQPQRLKLPPTTLLLTNGRAVSLPGPEIGYSPMLPPGPVDADSLRPLVAPEPPQPTTLWQPLWPLWGLIGCLLLWLWVDGRLGFLSWTPGPHTRALRALRRLPAGTVQDAQAFHLLEQALNEQAGHTLFPDQVEAFFATQPHYQPLAEAARVLLEQGWQARFGGDDKAFPARATLLALCRHFSERERAAWKT